MTARPAPRPAPPAPDPGPDGPREETGRQGDPYAGASPPSPGAAAARAAPCGPPGRTRPRLGTAAAQIAAARGRATAGPPPGHHGRRRGQRAAHRRDRGGTAGAVRRRGLHHPGHPPADHPALLPGHAADRTGHAQGLLRCATGSPATTPGRPSTAARGRLPRFSGCSARSCCSLSPECSGAASCSGSPARGQPWLFLHKASFVLWFGVMTIHVLTYMWRLPQLIGPDLRSSPRLRRTREVLGGRRPAGCC